MNVRIAEKIARAPIGTHRRDTFARAIRVLRRIEIPPAPGGRGPDRLLAQYAWRRRQAVPVPLLTWARSWDRPRKGRPSRVVAQTQVGDRFVSTVLLGIDHAFMGGPPILWESMIFGPPQLVESFGRPRMMALDTEEEDSGARYSSRWAALEDHERIVTRLKRERPPLVLPVRDGT